MPLPAAMRLYCRAPKGYADVEPRRLSRASYEKPTPEISEEEMNALIHLVTESLPISESSLQQFDNETKTDGTLQHRQQLIRTGWPESS